MLVGTGVGELVGTGVGWLVGTEPGTGDVGAGLGTTVGDDVGTELGIGVGSGEGAGVGELACCKRRASTGAVSQRCPTALPTASSVKESTSWTGRDLSIADIILGWAMSFGSQKLLKGSSWADSILRRKEGITKFNSTPANEK